MASLHSYGSCLWITRKACIRTGNLPSPAAIVSIDRIARLSNNAVASNMKNACKEVECRGECDRNQANPDRNVMARSDLTGAALDYADGGRQCVSCDLRPDQRAALSRAHHDADFRRAADRNGFR